MRRVNDVSILSNSDGSHRVTPHKDTVLAAGNGNPPDDAAQYVDEEEGLIVLDLGGGQDGQK